MHVRRHAASHEFIRLPLQSVISRPAPSAVNAALIAAACKLLDSKPHFFFGANELAIHVVIIVELPR